MTGESSLQSSQRESVSQHVSVLNSDKNKTAEDLACVCEKCGWCGPHTSDAYCRNTTTGPHKTFAPDGKRLRTMVLNPEFVANNSTGVEFTWKEGMESSANSELSPLQTMFENQESYKDDKGQVFVGRNIDTGHVYYCKCVQCTHPYDSFESPDKNEHHMEEYRIHAGLNEWFASNGGLSALEYGTSRQDDPCVDPENFFRILKKLKKLSLARQPEMKYGHKACQKCGFGDYPVTIEDREKGYMPLSEFVAGDSGAHTMYMPKGTKDVLESFDKVYYGLTSKRAHSMMKTSAGQEVISYPEMANQYSLIGNNGAGNYPREYHRYSLAKDDKVICPCQAYDAPFYRRVNKSKDPAGLHQELIDEDVRRHEFLAIECEKCKNHSKPNNLKIDRIEILNSEYRPFGPRPDWHYGLDHVGIPFVKFDEVDGYVDCTECVDPLKIVSPKMGPHGLRETETGEPMPVAWRLDGISCRVCNDQKVIAGKETVYAGASTTEIESRRDPNSYRHDRLYRKAQSLRAYNAQKKKSAPDGLASNYQRDQIFGNHAIKLPSWFTYDSAYAYAKHLGFGRMDKVIPMSGMTSEETVEEVERLVASEVQKREHMKTHWVKVTNTWYIDWNGVAHASNDAIPDVLYSIEVDQEKPIAYAKGAYCEECKMTFHHYGDATDEMGRDIPAHDELIIEDDREQKYICSNEEYFYRNFEGTYPRMVFEPMPVAWRLDGPRGSLISNRRKIYRAIVGSANQKHLSFAEVGKVQEMIESIITAEYQQWGDRLVIVSGGADGVDTMAAEYAESIGIETLIFRPDDQVKNVKNVGTWSPELHKYTEPFSFEQQPAWYDGEYNPDLSRIEIGFRTRNESIARKCGKLYCITILPGIGDLHPVYWDGVNKDKPIPVQCNHCGGKHYNNGGCWTAVQAKKRGVSIETIEIPDGGREQHIAPTMASMYPGTCTACDSAWDAGDYIYFGRADDGKTKFICTDKDCFVEQGGVLKLVL